jgi:hypothetical protein
LSPCWPRRDVRSRPVHRPSGSRPFPQDRLRRHGDLHPLQHALPDQVLGPGLQAEGLRPRLRPAHDGPARPGRGPLRRRHSPQPQGRGPAYGKSKLFGGKFRCTSRTFRPAMPEPLRSRMVPERAEAITLLTCDVTLAPLDLAGRDGRFRGNAPIPGTHRIERVAIGGREPASARLGDTGSDPLSP